MTQNERILHHIETHGSITQLEALQEYGCMRLASRITDLKRKGVKIKRITETSRNRYGEKIRFARYFRETEDNDK